jgi:mRNA-degrading endonuclease toxin of MazEF toxin-antitoxin module
VQERAAKANLSQMRVIDTRRLVEKIGFLNQQHFNELEKRARNLF